VSKRNNFHRSDHDVIQYLLEYNISSYHRLSPKFESLRIRPNIRISKIPKWVFFRKDMEFNLLLFEERSMDLRFMACDKKKLFV
jgi:hypothetical protein